jgi:hypothetical protein
MTTIDIYRKGNLLTTVKLNDTSVFSDAIMGDNFISLVFEDNKMIEFMIGDYCSVWGQIFTLRDVFPVTTTASNQYSYSLQMKGELSELNNVQYFDLGYDNTLRESQFALMCNAAIAADRILKNLERAGYLGWSIGEVADTGFKNLSFSGQTCLAALAVIAQEFNVEYWSVDKKIYIGKKSKDTGFTYRVGYNKGLQELTRVQLDNTSIITSLYAYGSDKNLPHLYNGDRLHLPRSNSPVEVSNLMWTVHDLGDGTQTIEFFFQPPADPTVTGMVISVIGLDAPYNNVFHGEAHSPRITLPMPVGRYRVRFLVQTLPLGTGTFSEWFTVDGSGGPIFPEIIKPNLEKNIDKYGLIERIAFFDEIYPHRTGVVTSMNAGDPFTIIDDTLDFDLNDYVLPGTNPKITFQDGQLAGMTFEVASYDPVTKAITFLKNKYEKNIDAPSDTIKAAIGNHYVLVDFEMPQEYMTKAERDLYDKAKEMLDLYADTQFTLGLKPDPKYLKVYNRSFNTGDLIWVKSETLGLDRKIRVTALTRNLVNETTYTLTLADVIQPGTMESIIQGIQSANSSAALANQVISAADIFNGRLILPTTPGGAGFKPVLVEIGTNKLFRQE